MKILLPLPFLILSGFAAAQNAAPVKNDVPAHVAATDAKTASQQAAAARQNANAAAPEGQPKVLDSVVAIVNGDVLLESDVELEQRLEGLEPLPPADNTVVRAAQHLVTRTLIVQQMKAQQESTESVTDAAITKAVSELRREYPGCPAAHCETAEGWAAFLHARALTPDEVHERWRQRLAISSYVDLRFRSGIRIAPAEVEKYYQANMLPEFEKKHQKPPPLKTLSPRIQEVLLQEQVSKQIDDWEATLREQGSVQILVPAYGQSTNNDDDDTGGGV